MTKSTYFTSNGNSLVSTPMIRVLLVDDEPALTDITRLYLVRAGDFIVDSVSSGPEALERCEKTRYDAIVSDYEMPEMNGIALLIALRRRGDTTSFIIFTGRGREEIAIQALNNGADFYLQKGGDPRVQFTELGNMIEQSVHRKRMEQKVLLNERRLAALLSLNQMRGAPIREMNDFALRSAVDLTGSTVGFFASVTDDRTRLLVHSWQEPGRDGSDMVPLETEIALDGSGILGSSVRAGEPIVLNESSGVLPGISRHEIHRYLEVPVMDGGLCVAVAGLANRTLPYTEVDARQATLLFEGLWQLLQRERAEQALRVSEERYRAVVEGQSELICRSLPDGTHVFANDAFCRYFGVSLDQVVGHCFSPSIPAADLARLDALFEGLTVEHPTETIEHRVVMKSGEIRWLHWSHMAFFDPEGREFEYQSVGRDVTERKRFEAALSESEHRFKVLAERSPVGIYLAVNDRLVYVNPRFAEIFDCPPDELVGLSFVDLVTRADRPAVGPFLHVLVTGEMETAHAEFSSRTRTGRPIVVEVHGTRTMIDGDVRIIGTALDITDRKEMERALLEQVNYVHALMDTISAPVFFRDTDGLYLDCNRAFEDLVGLPKELIKGKRIHDLFPKELADVYQEKDALIITKPHLQQYEFAITDAAGEMHEVLFSKTAKLRADGSVAGVVGVVLDISERKRMETELSEQVAYARALMDTIPVPVFYRDCAGVFRDCNRAFEALIDRPRDAIIGRTVHDIFSPAFADFYQGRDHELIADPGIQQYEAPVPDAHGVVYDALISKTTLLSATGTVGGIVGVIVDISDRKQTEEALSLANRKLNLLSSITRHDVLNTLTAQIGLIDSLRETDDPTEVPGLLARIQGTADVIQQQIAFTKDYQEIGVHSPSWQNVREAIERGVPSGDALAPLIGPELGEVEVFADPLLERVFFNLVENSRRHGCSSRIRIRGLPREQGFAIICDDDGEGIPVEMKDLIFEQGYGRNTGYGLFLAREILSITGLSIREDGKPGEGARFEIAIPRGAFRRVIPGSELLSEIIPD